MTLHEIVIKRVKWTTKDLCCGLTPPERGNVFRQSDCDFKAEKLKIDEVIPQVACSRFRECCVGQDSGS